MSSTEPSDTQSPEPSQTEFEFPITGLNELSELGRRRTSSRARAGKHRRSGPGPTGERLATSPLNLLSPQSRRLEIAPEAFGPPPWKNPSREQDAIPTAGPSELARHAGIAEFAITLLATLAFGFGWAAFELGGDRAGEPGDRIGIDRWVQHTTRGGRDRSVYAGAAGGAIGASVNASLDSATRLDDALNRRETTLWTTTTTTARMPKMTGSPRTSRDVNNSKNSSEFGPAGAKSKP